MRKLILTGLAVAALQAEASSANTMVAVSRTTPMTIDGACDEASYTTAVWSDAFTVMDPESKEINGLYIAADKKFTDLQTRATAFFDAQNLYIALLLPSPADVPPKDGDTVEVHLTNGGKRAYRVAVDMKGNVKSACYNADTLKESAWNANAKAAVVGGKRSAIAEIAIPFASLGMGTPPKAISCNIIRRGESTGGLSSWRPTNREQPDVLKFGRILLGEVEAAAVGETLPENKDKSVFFWGEGAWTDTPQVGAAVPLDKPEMGRISLVGPRGARAETAFRISNLTDRHMLYNIYVESGDELLKSRIRLREAGYIELRGGEVIPDSLFELPIGSVLRIAPKSTAILWVDADLSGLKVGDRKARLRFVPGYRKGEEKILPIAVKVGKADVSEIKMKVHYYHQGSNPITAIMAKECGFNVVVLSINTFVMKDDGSYDYTRADKKVESFLAAGIPKDELYVRLDLHLSRWATAGFPKEFVRKHQLKFLNPAWKRYYGERIKAMVAHLKEKYGIGYDRIELKTRDEPSGDPADPASPAYGAVEAAKFLKQLDPQLNVTTNPFRMQPEFLQHYLDNFDMLEPEIRRFMNGSADIAMADRLRDSGKKIGSYTVFVKQNAPEQYRRGYWFNMNHGFWEYYAVYGLIAKSGDSFNSYDKNSPKSKSRADWNAAYHNVRTGQITSSRRMEAWYQGLIDMKLVKWCQKRIAERKAKGEDMSRKEKRLAELIKEGDVRLADYDKIRKALFKLSEGL